MERAGNLETDIPIKPVYLTFNGGRTYTLRGVPERLYLGLLAASSPGRYFNDYLKGRY